MKQNVALQGQNRTLRDDTLRQEKGAALQSGGTPADTSVSCVQWQQGEQT